MHISGRIWVTCPLKTIDAFYQSYLLSLIPLYCTYHLFPTPYINLYGPKDYIRTPNLDELQQWNPTDGSLSKVYQPLP